MTSPTQPTFICNGEFEIVKINEDLYEETINLYKNEFMKYENISIACNLSGSQETIDEMEILIRSILKDGISFAARHCQTKKLTAICINKMLCPSTDCTLSEACESFCSPGMICVGEFLERMELTFDLHKEWQVDCVMEIVFLSTHNEFGGRGLATILSLHSINYARELLHGIAKDRESLPEHVRDLRPKAVSSVFTSLFSQKVGERLGMEEVLKIPYSEFSFQGKSFADILDPIHKYSVYAAMML